DEAVAAPGDVYDEPVAIAPIAQRATQDGHMDRKVGRLPRIWRASQCRTLVEIAHRSLRVRQGVRDQGITRWRHHEVMAAGHDDQILLTILLIDDRRGLAAAIGVPFTFVGAYPGSAKNASARASGSWSGAACRLKIGIRMARAATKIPALTKPHLRAPRPVVWSSRGATRIARMRRTKGPTRRGINCQPDRPTSQKLQAAVKTNAPT